MTLMVNSALEILRRERDEAAEQIRLMRTRIRDLDAAISVLGGQPILSKTGRSPGDFKLSVLKKLTELGDRGVTPKELADDFVREGRLTTDASVSSTLSRLKGEMKVVNRNGRWFAANPHDALVGNQSAETSENFSDFDDLDSDAPF